MAAWRNCIKSNNSLWEFRHNELLHLIEKNILPSGAGIDSGCKLNFEKSTDMRIVIDFSYHHMNEAGFYDGWTEHSLTITPSFDGIDLRISGKDRNQIKDYLYDTFHHCLTSKIEVNWNQDSETYTLLSHYSEV